MAIQVLNSSTTTVDASSATPIVVSVTNVGLTGPAGADAQTLSAGTGIDIVGTDISVDVSDFMSNGVDNRVVTASGADTMNAEANFTFSNEEVVIASTSSAKPTLSLANQNSDANGPGLIFAKQPFGSAANNDVAGTIQYQAFNDANQLTAITSISSQITNVADGSEAGKYNILVTANGSTIQPGLQLEGSSSANQVDVTIGAGASSVTTISGSASTGQLTSTSIVNAISGNTAGDFGSGAEILTGISNDSVTAGSIYVLKNGVWTLIDADAEVTSSQLVGVATAAAASSDSSAGMIIKGCVTLASAYTAGSDSEGAPVYASATAGEATLTAPSSSGQIVRILGFSLNVSNKKMFLNPDNTFRSIS
tara:strand:- start:3358 stop:4455 length:1098 start_codon:yes stop_codon:yes gene_type:complete